MTTISIADFVALLKDGGTLGLLAVILIGGSRGWWVFGRTYEDLRDERDAWRVLALNAQGLTDKAVAVAERAARSRR